MNKETFIAVDKFYEDLLIGENPQFENINRAAEAADMPSIQVSPLQGKFLQLMVQAQASNRVLEIGTLAGYSTAWLASGLKADGILITLEIDPHHAEVAEQNLSQFKFPGDVNILVGDGLQLIDEMILTDTEPFDLIFIDADKEGYADYLNRVVKLSRPGTLIIADNVVRNGKIIEKESQDSSVLGIQRFNQELVSNPRLTATTLQTVGARAYDGFTFIIVK
ncbi:MAG: O-methyltransferase [Anaerolineales bacterium]|nr:O-methyltransferase [Anaerolineales bacterium]